MLIIKVLLIILIICFIYYFNISKSLKAPYTGTNWQKIILIIFTTIFIIIIFGKPMFKSNYLEEENDIYNKYLVDAIMNGKLNIDLEPPEELQNLENPYDIEERQGIEYSFDTAYYNGKYYVYFGAVPALLLFIPYKLITGEYLSTQLGTIIFIIGSVIVNIRLTIEIYKRWFENIPFGLLILFIIGNLISGLYIWNAWRIWVYELTLMSGFFFVQLGLLLMLIATKEEQIANKNLIYVFGACLSMALAVGCRPTLVFASALLLPFIYKLIKRK